ncbi:hypothetical protein [Natrarchaeobius oligotrophus]|uniref:Uncharacterized protein n=1 Tax=Natrarchaeobius chitinivorans TaxID=1679083 RepID=A0A3N6N5Y3_NATCH|nr:hypothetical protein [Natrarchaeobius chitinivorans]RQG93732.1 hypothetical protein EA472_22625 [Natrarchaeobius chitinivorans]
MADVQDEVRWVLETIADQWPDGDFADETVVRQDFESSEVLETGRREGVELSQTAAISADEGDRARTPIGTEFHYDVETVVAVRVEGVHEEAGGTIASKGEFRRLVRYAQAAIDAERTYPSVDADDEVGFVHYEDARIENEQNVSSDYADDFRVDFDVRLTGKQDPDRR